MKAGYIWAHAFITAEFAASLEWQINYYLLMADSVDLRSTLAGDGGDVHRRVFRDLPAEPEASYPAQWHKRHAAGAYTAAARLPLRHSALRNFNFAFTNNVFTETLGTGIIYSRTLVDFGGVVMLFAYDMARSELYLSHELGSDGEPAESAV